MQWISLQTPPNIVKSWVWRGVYYFLMSALKHRLWVLIRTASLRRFERVPTRGSSNVYPKSMFWVEIRKISKIFILKFSFFSATKFRLSWIGIFFVILKGARVIKTLMGIIRTCCFNRFPGWINSCSSTIPSQLVSYLTKRLLHENRTSVSKFLQECLKLSKM